MVYTKLLQRKISDDSRQNIFVAKTINILRKTKSAVCKGKRRLLHLLFP